MVKAAKRKASAAASSSSTAPAPRAVSAEAPTVEHEEVALQPTSRRRLRARTTEEDVRKCERDNFPSYTYSDLHHNIVGGQSLHQKLTQDVHLRRQKNPDPPVMGKGYYEEMRAKFPSSTCIKVSHLTVADHSLPEDPSLDAALEGVVPHKKCFDQLLEWFENSKRPNQKVVICAAKAMAMYVKPTTPERKDAILAHMRWAVKHNLKSDFERECNAMEDTWVAACQRSLSSYKANGMTTNRWWSEHKAIGGLLVDAAACEKCMRNKSESWAALESELQLVVSANDFGYSLFAVQAQKLFKTRLAVVAKSVVEKHLVGKPVSEETVRVAKENFDAELKALGASGDTTFPLRPTIVLYRGVECSIEVVSYNDEWKAHVQALVRSVGVANGQLQELWGEKGLAPYQAPEGAKVDEALLKSSRLFRESAHDLARSNEAASGDKLKALFHKKQKWFHSLGRYCIIERSLFMSMVGESALEKVRALILKTLPTETEPKSIGDTARDFSVIGKSELLKFAGASAQGVFDEAYGLLQALEGSRIPHWPVGNSDYCNKLKDRMSLFYSQGSNGRKVYGKAAVEMQFRKVANMKRNNRGCQYSDITPLVVYGWLLSDEERKQVDQWSHQVLAAVGKKGGAKAAGSKSASGSEGRSKKGQSRDELRRAVSALWQS